ncbi:uncharacterized protein LOC135370408 [Ornithodoros turicata]|uniref:uncharacterized protein LOC135370408 n=1 Tax=Ornithodoros turicata TaxID=34597 RepID=UPI00313A3F02
MSTAQGATTFTISLLFLASWTLAEKLDDYHWSEDVPGFFRERVLEDGERERKIHFRKLTAVETFVDLNGKPGLALRQLSDGSSFLQLIFSGSSLIDCEYVNDPRSVSKFFRNLAHDFACAEHRSRERLKTVGHSRRFRTWGNDTVCDIELISPQNDTFKLIYSGRDLAGKEWKTLLNMRAMKRQCRKLHREIRLALLRHKSNVKEDDTASSLEDVDVRDIQEFQQGRDTSAMLRRKRDLFMYPGTNWCGTGNSARKFNELGTNSMADRCCRDHDHCPYTVEAFAKKFHMFNYRIHTVSHCECDERFRACLRMANNAASNMVGKVFFNIMQSKCFTFKTENICLKRSWWGNCLKRSREKVAVIRDGMYY